MIDIPTIDGATPIDDTSGLKINIHTNDQLGLAEAENITKTVLKYLSKKPSKRTAPFDFNWFLRLHEEMFGDVWNWAGIIRTHSLSIGVKAYQIKEELYKLLGDIKFWENSGMDVIEQAARIHHRAVQIHPFSNGNGRWSRMLANVWLKQVKNVVTVWPAEIGRVSSIRTEYIFAVKQADLGNYQPLIELHRKYTLIF